MTRLIDRNFEDLWDHINGVGAGAPISMGELQAFAFMLSQVHRGR